MSCSRYWLACVPHYSFVTAPLLSWPVHLHWLCSIPWPHTPWCTVYFLQYWKKLWRLNLACAWTVEILGFCACFVCLCMALPLETGFRVCFAHSEGHPFLLLVRINFWTADAGLISQQQIIWLCAWCCRGQSKSTAFPDELWVSGLFVKACCLYWINFFFLATSVVYPVQSNSSNLLNMLQKRLHHIFHGGGGGEAQRWSAKATFYWVYCMGSHV